MRSANGAEGLPIWSVEQGWAIGGSILMAASGIGAVWFLQLGHYRTAAALLPLAGLSIAAAFFVRAWHLGLRTRRDLADTRRRSQDLFDRAGISIWREDWSPVAEAIRALRTQGVEDVVGWFRDHPDEARATHARVLVTDVNRHGCHLMRAENPADLCGSLPKVLPGSFASFQRWLTAFCSGDRIYAGENRIRRLDGEPFDCFVTAAIPSDLADYREIMVSTLDVTDYKRDSEKLAEAREELARAQRIVAVGALAATIAHEVNSPLAAVSFNASACLRWLGQDPPVIDEAREAAQAALTDIERAQAVISHTRSYFTHAESRSVDTDLRRLIGDTVGLIEREAARHDVELSTQLTCNMMARCDPVQVQQALVNLCLNAIQAMKSSVGRRLLRIEGRRKNRDVAIVIEDTGPGIAPEMLTQIFDPFYSTKEGGMGMGLAVSRTCIEAQGGWITVDTEIGTGTRFEIILPTGASP